MDKERITTAISELSPERLQKLRTLAISQMTDAQKSSYAYESLLSLAMRRIMSKYCK